MNSSDPGSQISLTYILVAVYVSPQYFGFGMLFIAQATALLMFFFNGLERSLAKRVVSQAARPSKVVRQDETWKQENFQIAQ